MNNQHTSLTILAQQIDVYEEMPVLIPENLQDSVYMALAANLICMPIWLILLADFPIAGFLLVLNVVSLVLLGIVLIISEGMDKPVAEYVHWLGWAGSIPSGISALAALIGGVGFILYVMAIVIFWILCAMLFFVVLGAVFGV